MATSCEKPDFMFPLYADIYYPTITQGSFNEIKKSWMFDRTIVCNATFLGGLRETDIRPDMFLQLENKLISRSRTDIRITSNGENQALTNILITNIRTADGKPLYLETSGPRSGRATIFEVGSFEPFLGGMGSIEYYKMMWRRTENQAVEN